MFETIINVQIRYGNVIILGAESLIKYMIKIVAWDSTIQNWPHKKIEPQVWKDVKRIKHSRSALHIISAFSWQTIKSTGNEMSEQILASPELSLTKTENKSITTDRYYNIIHRQ